MARRKVHRGVSPHPLFGGLWDYSFYDRSSGVYLIYRSRQRPVLHEEDFDHPHVAPQDTLIHVPHEILYIGMSPIPKGVIISSELPPPPRGWPESYGNQGMFESISRSLASSILPL